LAASYFNVGLCSERAYERNCSHYGRVEVTTVSDFGNVNCRHVKARKVGDYLLKLKSCFVFRRQPAAIGQSPSQRLILFMDPSSR
jgi:hypothetical protein